MRGEELSTSIHRMGFFNLDIDVANLARKGASSHV